MLFGFRGSNAHPGFCNSPNIDSKRGYRNLAFSATHGAAKSMKDTANAGTKFVSTVAGATATLTNDIYKVGSDTVKSGAHRLGNIRITGLRSEATDNRKLQKTITESRKKMYKTMASIMFDGPKAASLLYAPAKPFSSIIIPLAETIKEKVHARIDNMGAVQNESQTTDKNKKAGKDENEKNSGKEGKDENVTEAPSSGGGLRRLFSRLNSSRENPEDIKDDQKQKNKSMESDSETDDSKEKQQGEGHFGALKRMFIFQSGGDKSVEKEEGDAKPKAKEESGKEVEKNEKSVSVGKNDEKTVKTENKEPSAKESLAGNKTDIDERSGLGSKQKGSQKSNAVENSKREDSSKKKVESSENELKRNKRAIKSNEESQAEVEGKKTSKSESKPKENAKQADSGSQARQSKTDEKKEKNSQDGGEANHKKETGEDKAAAPDDEKAKKPSAMREVMSHFGSAMKDTFDVATDIAMDKGSEALKSYNQKKLASMGEKKDALVEAATSAAASAAGRKFSGMVRKYGPKLLEVGKEVVQKTIVAKGKKG
ncbi:hypothetical protein GZH46_01531 [Fragariocoptes setiger]|uniref:Uncharacterized protein n=1 Tax=Fragariocoptes setiger TaxID=1670756 RepID=A0ABQ7S9B8_9ACAR|nr:hypothetical protein GZH46_01531 [Fragariocoptes setiger]